MKFKVYEVELEWCTEKDDDKQSFLYANYEDAVVKFKELVEEQKKVDWIEEALTRENDNWYQSELVEKVDYWCLNIDYQLDHMYSVVCITEREVF
jgi:hypothetical protein